MQQIRGINFFDQMAMQMQEEMVVPKTDFHENNWPDVATQAA